MKTSMSTAPSNSGEYICFNLKDLNNELEKLAAAVITESQGTLVTSQSDGQYSSTTFSVESGSNASLTEVYRRRDTHGRDRRDTSDGEIKNVHGRERKEHGAEWRDKNGGERKNAHGREKKGHGTERRDINCAEKKDAYGKKVSQTRRPVVRPSTAPTSRHSNVNREYSQESNLARESQSFSGPSSSDRHLTTRKGNYPAQNSTNNSRRGPSHDFSQKTNQRRLSNHEEKCSDDDVRVESPMNAKTRGRRDSSHTFRQKHSADDLESDASTSLSARRQKKQLPPRKHLVKTRVDSEQSGSSREDATTIQARNKGVVGTKQSQQVGREKALDCDNSEARQRILRYMYSPKKNGRGNQEENSPLREDTSFVKQRNTNLKKVRYSSSPDEVGYGNAAARRKKVEEASVESLREDTRGQARKRTTKTQDQSRHRERSTTRHDRKDKGKKKTPDCSRHVSCDCKVKSVQGGKSKYTQIYCDCEGSDLSESDQEESKQSKRQPANKRGRQQHPNQQKSQDDPRDEKRRPHDGRRDDKRRRERSDNGRQRPVRDGGSADKARREKDKRARQDRNPKSDGQNRVQSRGKNTSGHRDSYDSPPKKKYKDAMLCVKRNMPNADHNAISIQARVTCDSDNFPSSEDSREGVSRSKRAETHRLSSKQSPPRGNRANRGNKTRTVSEEPDDFLCDDCKHLSTGEDEPDPSDAPVGYMTRDMETEALSQLDNHINMYASSSGHCPGGNCHPSASRRTMQRAPGDASITLSAYSLSTLRRYSEHCEHNYKEERDNEKQNRKHNKHREGR